ncbi:hypothetical protein T492DRAFT_836523 [Pavlovales sp. CCMP2436]|nr:hypothetical protein T492DRAFT_836523 [Pavlovales sp. CCMP2436]
MVAEIVLSVIGAAAGITTAIWNLLQILKQVSDAALASDLAASHAAHAASAALEELALALVPVRKPSKPKPRWTTSRQAPEVDLRGAIAATTIQGPYRRHRLMQIRYGAFEFNLGEER